MAAQQTIRHRLGGFLTCVGSHVAAAGFVSGAAILPLAGLLWLALALAGAVGSDTRASRYALLAVLVWAAALAIGMILVFAGHRLDNHSTRRRDL